MAQGLHLCSEGETEFGTVRIWQKLFPGAAFLLWLSSLLLPWQTHRAWRDDISKPDLPNVFFVLISVCLINSWQTFLASCCRVAERLSLSASRYLCCVTARCREEINYPWDSRSKDDGRIHRWSFMSISLPVVEKFTRYTKINESWKMKYEEPSKGCMKEHVN